MSPESVAVIGASTDPGKASGRTLRYLRHYGFHGRAYAVNPARDEVQGFPSFPSVRDIPERVDLAMIVTSGRHVLASLEDCVQREIPSVIIVSAGFAEIGDEGRAMQAELEAVVAGSRTRVLGPNCVGIVSTRVNLAATINTGLDQDRFQFRNSGVALVSQSGAMGAFIFSQCQGKGVGLGSMLSTGNEMDVSLTDMLNASIDDPAVTSIVGYIEGIRDGRGFIEALERAQAAGKPIAMMKAGRSDTGQRAIASHTGALAGSDKAYDAIFEQYGVHRLDTIRELGDYVELAAVEHVTRGPRLSVATTSGGAGILVADYCERFGLTLAEWDADWQQRLGEALPHFSALGNPIDMTGAGGRPEVLAPVLDTLVSHPGTDVALLMLGNLENNEDALVEIITEKAATSPVPLVVVWVGGSGKPGAVLSARGIPCFAEPLDAVRAIAARRPNAAGSGRAVSEPVDEARRARALDLIAASGGAGAMDEVASKELLGLYGIPVVEERRAPNADEAASAAERIGFPVVLKAVHPELLHKSDVGGVVLDLVSGTEVHREAEAMAARIERQLGLTIEFTVQRMVPSGHEMLIGVKRDPDFGLLLVVGSGGLITELLDDVVIRVPRLDDAAIRAALQRLRAYRLLDGYRNGLRGDVDALVDSIRRVIAMISEIGDRIDGLDVNPLIVRPDGNGAVAVDALAFLRGAVTDS
ncbi:acetate--CoA ligase family protein [Ruicaihuangia caeni]|uniref:Acetate--CoA ligase family protein n=1 Tax=Ruicaihuangia caeni TaxID=3042517 RepID=A0AAW6TAU2_9MICO|nr:acetate--CoA ligase family protein [Klugiella sp. YN-L-19]MDI2098697.1 acetate--CoA ligase family protein [Klugiella sp. YN-L-19]